MPNQDEASDFDCTNFRDFDTLFSTPFDTYASFNSRAENDDDRGLDAQDLQARGNKEADNPVGDFGGSGSERYPRRIRNPLERFHEQEYSKCVKDYCYKVSSIPTTDNQATRCEDGDEWQVAMETEMKALKDNNVFSIVPLPKDKKVVGSRWVYSVKEKPDGSKLHKARFVAKGFSQVEGSDYSDTYSPTVKMTTVRILIQVAAENQMSVHQLDVKTAYLNAPIDCEVYIRQPQDGNFISLFTG